MTVTAAGNQVPSPDHGGNDGAASPRRLRAGRWELLIFRARPARSTLLISGKT